jgi:V/A-type H+-transporting ATPase subunit I
MITKMKKVTVVGLASRDRDTLKALRELGVLHVAHIRKPESHNIEAIRGKVDVMRRAIAILESCKLKEYRQPCETSLDMALHVNTLLERKSHLEEHLRAVDKDIAKVEDLGDFSPDDIALLKARGLDIRIYRCSKKELAVIPESTPYEIVGEQGSARYVLAVKKGRLALPFEEIEIPSKSLSSLRKEAEDIRKKIHSVRVEIDAQAVFKKCMKEELKKFEHELEFDEVLAGMGREEVFSYLQGFSPEDEVHKIRESAAAMGWAMLVEDPSPEDDVPTLIRNKKWLRIIQPVFDFLSLSPGYMEYDISLVFLISLSIFFAMLIGDGGIGLILLGLTFFFRKKFKDAPNEPFILFYLMSGMTILWGAVTGTWFSIEKISQLPVLRNLIIPPLYGFSDNERFMMQFCFTLAVIHLTIAHSLRIARFGKSLQSVGQAGWILIVWSAYFLAGSVVIGNPFPGIIKYIFILGVLLAGIVPYVGPGFLKNFLLSLTEFPFSIISAFADIVSYLRLYLVGYASFAMSISFMQMAQSFDVAPVVRYILLTCIMLFGYTLNVVLGLLSVVVHGVRLNLLEFSTHLGMTWSGRKYEPFK